MARGELAKRSPKTKSKLTSETATDPGPTVQIEKLPKELGVLLMVAGIGGLLMPAPVGSPLLIMGGVVLWPRAFRRVDETFRKRFPRLHQDTMRQLVRFLADLDRRYPLPD